MSPPLSAELDHSGFAIRPSCVDPGILAQLARQVEAIALTHHHAGARNLFQLSVVRTIALSPRVVDLVEQVLGPRSAAVRALWFDKTDRANWKVAWHQDLTIAA